METVTTNELWVKESTSFEMIDGTIIEGYRLSFVRMLNDNETLDGIDEGSELEELMGGTSGVSYTDQDLNYLDEDKIVDETPHSMFEFFVD